MKCIECGREKDRDERGWVIVLSPLGEQRTHYCPDCMDKLLGHAGQVDADHAANED
jgi:hypothetical protein